MYFEEKIIDGILHFRHTPHDEFIAYTLEQLTMIYMELKLAQLEAID